MSSPTPRTIVSFHRVHQKIQNFVRENARFREQFPQHANEILRTDAGNIRARMRNRELIEAVLEASTNLALTRADTPALTEAISAIVRGMVNNGERDAARALLDRYNIGDEDSRRRITLTTTPAAERDQLLSHARLADAVESHLAPRRIDFEAETAEPQREPSFEHHDTEVGTGPMMQETESPAGVHASPANSNPSSVATPSSGDDVQERRVTVHVSDNGSSSSTPSGPSSPPARGWASSGSVGSSQHVTPVTAATPITPSDAGDTYVSSSGPGSSGGGFSFPQGVHNTPPGHGGGGGGPPMPGGGGGGPGGDPGGGGGGGNVPEVQAQHVNPDEHGLAQGVLALGAIAAAGVDAVWDGYKRFFSGSKPLSRVGSDPFHRIRVDPSSSIGPQKPTPPVPSVSSTTPTNANPNPGIDGYVKSALPIQPNAPIQDAAASGSGAEGSMFANGLSKLKNETVNTATVSSRKPNEIDVTSFAGLTRDDSALGKRSHVQLTTGNQIQFAGRVVGAQITEMENDSKLTYMVRPGKIPRIDFYTTDGRTLIYE